MHSRCVRRAVALSRGGVSDTSSSASNSFRRLLSTSKAKPQMANTQTPTPSTSHVSPENTQRKFDPTLPREVLATMAPFAQRQQIAYTRERAGPIEQEGPDEEDSNGLEEQGIVPTFQEGAYVEIRRNNVVLKGVVLGEVVQDRLWRVISLLSNGEVLTHRRTDVHFCIPNFISQDLAHRCGTAMVVTTQTPATARVEVLRRLRELSRASEFAAHRVARVQTEVNVYDHVRNLDPERWGRTTVSEVAALLYAEPTLIELLGVHQYLMGTPLRYVASPNYLQDQTFTVRPLVDVDDIGKVENWVQAARVKRGGEHVFEGFVKRAKGVIKRYEQRDCSTNGEPQQLPASHKWKEEDRTFLRFMVKSHHAHRTNQADVYASGRNAITKAILGNTAVVTTEETRMLLVKLGVIAPWQDLYSILPQFDGHRFPEPGSDEALRDEAMLQKSLISTPQTTSRILAADDLHPLDPLDHVRHDFGNLPVFVIDDATAEELDDGISVERIPSEPEHFWLHVHIADPTSVLHPGHRLSLRARQLTQTAYFAHGSYPLFPRSLMYHDQRGLSLGNPRNERGFDRTMTLSMKMDRKANMLDYKVRAGIIRNVKMVSYDSVDAKMGWPSPSISRPFDPGALDLVVEPADLTPEEVEDLKLLNTLMQDQLAKRLRSEVVAFAGPVGRTNRFVVPKGIQTPTLKPSVFSGFPRLEFVVEKMIEQGARVVVSECMKLACTAASRFALDHGVPLLRRTAGSPMYYGAKAKESVLAGRDKAGTVCIYDHLGSIRLINGATYTTEPLEHALLGIPNGVGYARVTSPLRRYEDLVAHWQLQHILLGKDAPPQVPFSDAQLQRFIPELQTQNAAISKGQDKNAAFYAFMFVKKWMEDTARGVERPHGDPLRNLKARVAKQPVFDRTRHRQKVDAFIMELGLPVQLVDVPETIEIGQDVDVELVEVRLGIQDAGIIGRPKM